MYSFLTFPENTYIVALVWDPLVILIVTFVSFAIFFHFHVTLYLERKIPT